MTQPDEPIARRTLSPIERISEMLFGLIMVLSFTGSLSVADAGKDDVRTMLIGALGCNLVWGIIDGALYLMGCLAARGENLRAFRAARRAADAQSAQRIIAEALPPVVASVIEPAEFEAIHGRLTRLPEPANFVRLRRADWKGAAGVFLLVFFTTLPVAVPFMLFARAETAMRVSNGVALAMLFGLGHAFGRCLGRNPWRHAVYMVFLGGALVALTIALGG